MLRFTIHAYIHTYIYIYIYIYKPMSAFNINKTPCRNICIRQNWFGITFVG